jgi:steroid 5-alpha reductase family enzyme
LPQTPWENDALTELLPILLTNMAALAAATVLLWGLSVLLSDASIADVFWGVGFVLVAWTSWAVGDATAPRVLVLNGLITVWGLRLAVHLLWRRWGEPEDRRYVTMRERHTPHFWWWSFFSVFLLQAMLIGFIALPVQVAAARDLQSSFHWLDGIGMALWSVGFAFEAVGDWQLARFTSNPANAHRVMDRGLWRYTRHPNYFGDFWVWWGVYLVAAAGGAAATIASPALMSLLLLRVSGVTLLESKIADRRPGYAEYKRRVNAFFPGPPRP